MSEWISVKDRLPDIDLSVLVYNGQSIEVMAYWYDEDEKPNFMNPPAPPCDFVTHWMPLPEPPNECLEKELFNEMEKG